MIVVPAWIESEEPNGFWAVLGSEPPSDAKPEFIPRKNVQSCVYAPESDGARRFAIIIFQNETAPEKIKTLMKR